MEGEERYNIRIECYSDDCLLWTQIMKHFHTQINNLILSFILKRFAYVLLNTFAPLTSFGLSTTKTLCIVITLL